jgi:hypothetical protein
VTFSRQACIIGAETKELLYMGVCNRYCYPCARAQKLKITAKKHRCYKNYEGTSTGMEQTIIVQGFRASEEMHGLRFKFMIGDGDSSVYARVQKSVRYGPRVVKLECANHMVRCYTDKLYKLKANAQVDLSARKVLAPLIPRLTKDARGAITSAGNDPENVAQLRNDLRNGPHHVFGDHSRCRSEITSSTGEREGYCKRKDDVEKNNVPFLQQTPVWAGILKALEPLVTKADRLTRNVTTNQAERFMGLVAAAAGGKRVDHTKRGGYQMRCALAGLRHRKGPSYFVSPMKTLLGQSPGAISKKLFAARATELAAKTERTKARRSLGYVPRRKATARATSADADYGPEAAEPDMSEADLEAGMDAVLEKLAAVVCSDEKRSALQRSTVGQAGKPEWREARRRVLTASKFGSVCKRRLTTPCHAAVTAITNPKEVRSNDLTYGTIHEPIAIERYEQRVGVTVEPCGLFVDPDNPFLGASPDGLVGQDKLVEVKTIPSINGLVVKGVPVLKIKEAAKVRNMFVGISHDGQLFLKQSDKYFYQIQGQLNITKRQFCDLVMFTDTDLEIITIERDVTFWTNEMVPHLRRFYLNCVLPEIVDPRETRNMRARDPAYIIEARAAAKSKARVAGKPKQSAKRTLRPSDAAGPSGKRRELAPRNGAAPASAGCAGDYSH